MVSNIQKEKAERFLKFHHDQEILVLLNSWDIGTSKLVEACGFKAVATTSMGIAASLGCPDCEVIQLDEMIGRISGIVNAVQIPVTVDIEAGYGNNVNEIIGSVTKIIETGIVGINIEDSIELNPVLIDEAEFCERISAIRELSDSLGFHLVIMPGPIRFIRQKLRRPKNYQNQSGEAINTGKQGLTAYLFSLSGIKKLFQHW